MARSIRLPEDMMIALRREAAVQGRTLVGKAMHWVRLGQAVEESGVLGDKRIRALLETLDHPEPPQEE